MALKQSGPVIVQIHALGADAAMWSEYSSIIAPKFRTLSPNLFGIGETPRHTAPPTASDHADHLVAGILDLGENVVLSGCAIGAMIATEVAALLGNHVRGLIMANPILRITQPAGEVLRERATRARDGGISAVEQEIVSRAFEGLEIPERRQFFRQRLLAMSGASYADLAEGIVGCDITRAIHRLTCPILLIAGGQDRILPTWHCEEIAALAPGAQICTAPSGGHFMPQQAPEEFAASTRRFLDDLAVA
ncbi:alpha/beta fold hydrolase [Puniceibacterium sp. IMCC21224]|uniref:alpha/beta fold hydrolase n=1 Tax=Puniceibacterium sp. IMCC21224 TaxID=1618204 RepID=UPI00064DFC9A|nr:alpha/beta hydrolase [Puniceibacterium sp. IMCC21224]KMK64948.1 putative hydrolase or acyltransferase of alpha/beta superfamily [Puniceibacterium sp. IMCC21224]